MRLKSENQTSPYFSNKVIQKLHKLLDPEMLEESQLEAYYDLLVNLIVKGKSVNFPDITIPILKGNKSEDLVKITLLGHFYYSFKFIFKLYNEKLNLTLKTGHTPPFILLWGYDLILKNKKEVIVNCNISKLNFEQLTALWTVIKLSKIESIKGLKRFRNLSPEAWEILCSNIAESNLLAFHFSETDGLFNIPPIMWKLFWDKISLSNISHFTMPFVKYPRDHIHPSFWDTLWTGIKKSKIKTLSLDGIFNNLGEEQWINFYEALRTIEIEFLDITKNYLSDDICYWIGKIINIPSLKHLRWLNVDFQAISSDSWLSLCQSLSNSRLEHLEISISKGCFDNEKDCLPVASWITFIEALKKLKLKSLIIKHHSANELSSPVVQTLAEMISESSLESFSCIHSFHSLKFSSEDWRVLGEAIKKRGIKSFDFGRIEFLNDNFSKYSNFVSNSGMDSFNLSAHNLNQCPLELWTKLSNLIKKAAISTLNIIGNNLAEMELEKWQIFCDMVENGSIRTLYLDTISFNRLNLTQDHVDLFSKAIQFSQLETLVLDIHENFVSLPFYHMKSIFYAINRSKIIDLNLKNLPEKPFGLGLMLDTLRIIENKANYKNTLFGSCIYTLFGRCNAQLTETGISYTHDGNQQEVELDDACIDNLKRFIQS